MNWEAISAVGQIVGAIAVVVSLLYLSNQIRQSTRVARASTRHEITQSAMIGGRILAESDQVAELLLRRASGEELSPSEHLRVMGLAYMTTRNWENIHYQFLSGMLTKEEWAAFRENLRSLFQNPVWQEYWDREEDIYTAAFRSEVAAILEEIARGQVVASDSALFNQVEVARQALSADSASDV